MKQVIGSLGRDWRTLHSCRLTKHVEIKNIKNSLDHSKLWELHFSLQSYSTFPTTLIGFDRILFSFHLTHGGVDDA